MSPASFPWSLPFLSNTPCHALAFLVHKLPPPRYYPMSSVSFPYSRTFLGATPCHLSGLPAHGLSLDATAPCHYYLFRARGLFCTLPHVTCQLLLLMELSCHYPMSPIIFPCSRAFSSSPLPHATCQLSLLSIFLCHYPMSPVSFSCS